MTQIDLTATLALALSPAAWVVQLWGAEGVSQIFWAQHIMAAALAVLRAHGIKLRDTTSFGLPGCVRLGVLPPASQQALEQTWTNACSRKRYKC